MECFLDKSGPRLQTAQLPPEMAAAASLHNMAEAPDMEISVDSTPPTSQHMEHNTERIAQAVAALLAPTIASSVEKTVQAGMAQIRKELGEHATHLNETDIRLSNIEL